MYLTGTKCQLLLISCFMSLSVFAKDVKTSIGNGFEKPLCFVENKGQVRSSTQARNDIQFQLYGKGVDVYVGSGALHYQFRGTEGKVRRTYLMDVNLLGAKSDCKVTTSGSNSYYETYFLTCMGNDGITAHSFDKVIYHDVYPNIDWVLYIHDGQLEYDFNVKPGGNVKDIQIAYTGANKLAIDANGALIAQNPMGMLTEHTPFSYESATKRPVSSKFTLNQNVVGFETGNYKGAITIDPYLSWATYFGGSSEDIITCVKASAAGDIYVCGYSNSNDLNTTTGVLQANATTGGSTEAFVAKFNSSGTLQFATYFGGTRTDQAISLDYDNSTGSLFVVGNTNSAGLQSGFSVNKPFFSTGSGFDMFLLKLNSTGTTRGYSTYIGGTSNDQATSVACDGSGNVIVGGFVASTYRSSSPDISTDGTNLSGSQDGYLGKFSTSGSGTRVWSTYVGGTGSDEIDGVVIDGSGNITTTGQTSSAGSISTTGAYQTILGGTIDAFVISFNSTGSRRWGTYLGGSGDDQGTSIAIDAAGNYFVTGNTASTDSIAAGYATTSSFGGGTQDGFIAKLSSTGVMQWSTYIGGNAADYPTGIAVDRFGNAVVTGYTPSTSGISTSGAYQTSNGGSSDAFVTKYSNIGQRYYATYFGNSLNDLANSVTTDPSDGSVIIAGSTRSTSGIATSGASQTTFAGGTTSGDGFIARFLPDTLVSVRESMLDTFICAGGTITIFDTTINTFQSGNTFTVQLSDASGSFASPTTIGSSTATSAGSISCTIPSGTTPGTGYKIRIVASNPAYISPENRYNISIISALPAVTVNYQAVVCVNSFIALSTTAPFNVNNYNWAGPASFSSTSSNPVIGTLSSGNTGIYTVTLTHNGCPAVTNTFSVTVNTYIPPAPIDTVNSPICNRSTVYLYTTPSGIPGTYTYNWSGPGTFTSTLRNPVIVGATLANAGTYYAVVELNNCFSPAAPINVSIIPSDTANIQIYASPNDTVCLGTTINFTSSNTHAGFSPTYQWMSDAATPVVGAVFDRYSTATFPVGNHYYCIMRSNAACPDKLYDTSNVITITTLNNTPVVQITVSPDSFVRAGSTVTYHGIIGGNFITGFQWYVNNSPVVDTTMTLVLRNVRGNEVVRLEAISADYCANIGVSNTITLHHATAVGAVTADITNVELFPNPNTGAFHIKGDIGSAIEKSVAVSVTNTLGQVVYAGEIAVMAGHINAAIDLSNVAPGMYVLQVKGIATGMVARFIKE